MGDLTLRSFAYLKAPLVLAGLAFLIGAFAAWFYTGYRAQIGLAIMMVLFFHAARIAMIAFDPYLSSQPLAAALKNAPPGRVVFDNQYYTFSSVFFYADVKQGLLLNGRVNNLEYGSYAPGAPQVFIDDHRFSSLWREPALTYLFVEQPSMPRLQSLVPGAPWHIVKASGGKFLISNQP